MPKAATLCAADRDALLSALHRRLWGDRILSSPTCVGCGAPFDLSFRLSDMQRHLHSSAVDWSLTGERQVSRDQGRARRIPCGVDELAAAEQGPTEGPAALAALCGDASADLSALADDLEEAAPILDLDLDAACPECGQDQSVRFDIQSWLLGRIIGERDRLLGEIHTLASAYGWSLREILDLPRGTRRSLSALSERPAAGAEGLAG